MLPWKTMLAFDRSCERAVYLQIAEGLIRAVCQGHLKAGQRLPGTRKIAELIRVNRKTAGLAYEELMAQGWVEIRPSQGAFIANDLPLTTFQTIKQSSPGDKTKVGENFNFPFSSIVFPYQKPAPHQIFIGGGVPDERLAPMERLLKNYRTLLKGYQGRKLLRYGDVQGPERSRQILADYLQQTRGLNCQAQQILFTRGSQMGIYIFFRSLIQPGDRVLVSNPNYDAADWTIRTMGGELVRVDVDREGIDVAQIETVCRRQRIRAAYITPHHHYPTTVTLSAQRRMQLMHLAEKYNFYILEDDYDYSFHYQSAPILPMASIDRSGRVIYLGSFSKFLAPSVRVGYLIAPQALAIEFGKLRRIIDRQGDPLLEAAVCQLIADGDLQRHLKKVVRVYQRRRDHFCNLLSEKFTDLFSFEKPEGGMAVWMRLKKRIDPIQLIKHCEMQGLYLDIDQSLLKEHQGIRLGFAALTEEELGEAIAIMKKALISC